MALRSRLNKAREGRDENQGNSRFRRRERQQPSGENEEDIPEEEGGQRRSKEQELAKVGGDSDPKGKASSRHDENEGESDRKKEEKPDEKSASGRSLASRFRRGNKKNDEKTKNEQEELNVNEKDEKLDKKKNNKHTNKHELDTNADADAVTDNREQSEKAQLEQLEKDLEAGPLRVLEPIRSDPVAQLKTRQKKLERLTAEILPEVHLIGNITSGSGIITENSEGATCRWKVECGSGWEHLGGELFGQTHVAYPRFSSHEVLSFNHPLDMHFAEPGISTWSSPRLLLQSYRVDQHGRRMLSGYGFIHLPVTKGLHKLEVSMWRPTGTNSEEMDSSYLGRVPALTTHEPIYESAWDERCRLVTVPAGSIFVELFVMTRFIKHHNTDVK